LLVVAMIVLASVTIIHFLTYILVGAVALTAINTLARR
jgi:hypothetical protein